MSDPSEFLCIGQILVAVEHLVVDMRPSWVPPVPVVGAAGPCSRELYGSLGGGGRRGSRFERGLRRLFHVLECQLRGGLVSLRPLGPRRRVPPLGVVVVVVPLLPVAMAMAMVGAAGRILVVVGVGGVAVEAHGDVFVGADLEEHHLAALEAGQRGGEPLHELGVDAAAGAELGGGGREAPAEPGGEEGAGLLQLGEVPAARRRVAEPRRRLPQLLGAVAVRVVEQGGAVGEERAVGVEQ
ncbi:unnamed protein product [Triticum turgidum subsp. durum]|uniref:Uncharacterized protein n=1 Tax=Triticum turgidum subsp. durum TaxID=4567 RepID=A0A9R0W8T8_TRITD|nr:unnamed protein product [Triticum turgidum subsp. durum]